MIHSFLRLLPVALLVALHTPASAQDTVLITLKLVKRAGVPTTIQHAVNLPSPCSGCAVLSDPAYVKENAREIVLALQIPRSTSLPVSVSLPPQSIRRVLLEGIDLPYREQAGAINFVVPPQPVDAPNSGEVQTHILWPGLDLRFEHGDPARRSGDYSAGTWPQKQLEAAHNLEFAQMEAIRMLGLDKFVASKNIGTIDLMGFDTNDPHGHLDSPPHMHMILWWPTVRGTGSLVAHYYINERGLLTHALVSPLGAPGLQPTDFQPGQTFTDTDIAGEPVYTHTITPEGWLRIGRAGGTECLIRPVEQSFDQETRVECSGFPVKTVQVHDDFSSSTIEEIVNKSISTNFKYDPDTFSLRE